MTTFFRLFDAYRRLHPLAILPDAELTRRQRAILHRGARWHDQMMSRRFGGALDLRVEIGNDVKFPHDFLGVFIAGMVRIGDGTVIYQQVTLGQNYTPHLREEQQALNPAPHIGANVLIGAGAKLIGRCIIGDGAKIGAGVTLVDATIAPGAIIINKSAYDLTNRRFVYPQD